uniref:VanZ family protein n=1 Tax=Blautia faecicola TaxID=2509240 RepID=UPI003520BEC4
MKIKAKSNMKKMPAKYYVGVYAFLVYLWAVFKVTGIGLLADIIRPGIRGGVNLRPFADLGIGFWLNIVMFLPLGIVIPCTWKKCESVRYTVRLGFAVSLLIECSQIFNGRATDIDDLIANTSGACLGYVIWFITRKIAGKNCGEKYKMAERKWEPAIYVALAFLGTFFLYNPYAI